MAQGLNALDAAKLGVYLHGAAADALLTQGLGPVGLTASELVLEARIIINQLNAYKSIS
jgi:NAD(P)H-hydrate repair Nnr-like enzyme with NAD(P)H-hydrate dehydratase domain